MEEEDKKWRRFSWRKPRRSPKWGFFVHKRRRRKREQVPK
jgi:hypothetical protein